MSPKQNINLNVGQEKSVSQENMGSFWERLKSIPAERLAWLWLLIGFLLLPFTAWQIVNARILQFCQEATSKERNRDVSN